MNKPNRTGCEVMLFGDWNNTKKQGFCPERIRQEIPKGLMMVDVPLNHWTAEVPVKLVLTLFITPLGRPKPWATGGDFISVH